MTSGSWRCSAVELVRLNARGEAKWTITISTSRDKRDHGTDGGGRIDFHGVTDGRYAVVVAAGPWSIGCGTLDVRGADEETVFHEVELGSHEVVVRVVDVQGRPVTEAQPGIASADPWVGATMRPSRNVVAADGHYVVPLIPSGRFRAYVNAKGDIHASSGEFIVDDDTEKATVTVEMPLTGVLSVRVVTASGRPVRDAEVSVDRSGETPYYHHRTDGNGTLERTVAAEGEWIVRVRRGAESDVESARVIVEPYSKTVVNVTVDKPMK